jgi:hypothetical protein
MRISLAGYLSLLLLAGCDVQLTFHGTVSSSAGLPLHDCAITLQSRGDKIKARFDPPRFDQGYAVEAFHFSHNITIECDGHLPRKIDATTNGGDLGNIVLTPIVGT